MNRQHFFSRFASNWKETFKKHGITINAGDFTLPDELYLCPISLNLHSIESLKNKELTIEHVPPKSLGGKELVLVAKEVNNTDGHTSDKDVLLFFQTKNFIEHEKSMNAKISAESLDMKGITTKFSLQNLKASKSENPCANFVTSKKGIDALKFNGVFDNWNGLQFKVSLALSTNLNIKTMLKCAYLTAFSRVGYDLLFDRGGFKVTTYGFLLNILNNRADESNFPFICQEGHAPLEETDVGVVTTSNGLQALVVNLIFKLESQMYKYYVFLPHPNSADLENLKNIKSLSGNVKFDIGPITSNI
ncbi:hypothetical protein [Sphingobacterium faecale]|uniref:Uncharacterized protein n=1 Tax=Sphingobacterium faecale TaxID=2803775 RepID=A0ABS1R2D6_9SPHI|nr:hypothetical protein [Sphingobacterium faecale]MBL1408813.1 hypothetical protein [Sphingobacterium faecale]